MNRKLARDCVVAWIVVSMLAAAPHARAATPEQVDAAIAKAQKWLLDHRSRDGTWEQVQTPTVGDAVSPVALGGRQWGGLTAIATYAMLAAGEDPASKELKPAVDFLLHANIQSTYGLAFQSQIVTYLPEKDRRDLLKRNTAMLLAGMIQPSANVLRQPQLWTKGTGFYSYWTGAADSPAGGQFSLNLSPQALGTPQPRGEFDHSNAQYGVFGIKTLADAGGEVPPLYWQIVDTAWRRAQQTDGGWNYTASTLNAQSTASMTAAGVATLLTAADFISDENPSACKGMHDDAVEKGIGWLTDNLAKAPAGDLYTMFALSRVGLADGRKYFGTTNWRDAAFDYLVKHQRSDGTWTSAYSPVVGNSFGLLILSRGRASVLMNKLQYPSNRDPEGWNERPRDVAHFVDWMGRSRHAFFRWQTVSLDGAPGDLHEAPILYLSGSQPIQFTKAAEDALRDFVENGGMILGNADCGKEPFSRSFMRLGAQLFPQYEFHQTPPTDLIFTEQYNKFRTKLKVMELSNGVRKLMVLLPDVDAGRAWQARSFTTKEDAFDLAANIVMYATDKKLTPAHAPQIAGPGPAGAGSETALKVARLDVGGNCNPEPAGWKRLATLVRAGQKIDLKVDTVKPEAMAGYKIADITGTGKCTLTPSARAAIKQFVEGGGTLIVDAAGGDAEFGDSAESELAATFAPVKFDLLPKESPVYSQRGAKIGAVGWRDFASGRVKDPTHPKLRGMVFDGRIGVFFSREDLSAGLVGEDVDGIYGYDTATATHLMEAMLSYANGPHEAAAKPPVLVAGPGTPLKVAAAMKKREDAITSGAAHETMIDADVSLLETLEAQKKSGDASPELQAQIDAVKTELAALLHGKPAAP